MNTDSSMKMIQDIQENKNIGMLMELVLSISLQIGCWYTVLGMLSVSISDTLLLPVLAMLGAFWYLIYRYLPVPLWMLLVSAVCIVLIAAVRQPIPCLLCGSILTAQMTGFGLKRNIVILPLLAFLVPTAVFIIRAETLDIWYFGLLLLGCCGLFAMSAVKSKEKRANMECMQLRAFHSASFPGVFLLIILIVILFYAFFFTPQSYRAFPAIEKIKAVVTDSLQDVTEPTEEEEEDIPDGGQSQTQMIKSMPLWLLILLWILLILLFLCIIAAIIFEIVMHRRLKKRKTAFGVDFSPETAFDMYRYMDSLFSFDGCTVDENPYCSMYEVAWKYDAVTGGCFPVIAEGILRLRFGGPSSSMSEEEHKQMAEYCRKLCNYVYEKQKWTGKFKMRFIKCYI